MGGSDITWQIELASLASPKQSATRKSQGITNGSSVAELQVTEPRTDFEHTSWQATRDIHDFACPCAHPLPALDSAGSDRELPLVTTFESTKVAEFPTP